MMKRIFGGRSGTAIAAADRRNSRRFIFGHLSSRGRAATTYNGWVNPRCEYTERLEARRAVSARYERAHLAIGNWRVAIALAAVILAVLAFGYDLFSGWFLLAPVAVSMALGVVHERVLQRKRACDRAAAVYEAGLARLEDRWRERGVTGDRFRDETHPYADDLDVFGKGSLFQLLCTARTRPGEETLARWLLGAAPVEQLRERQQAIQEMRPMLDLREDLAVLAETVGPELVPERLALWGEAQPIGDLHRPRAIAAVLAVLSVVAAVWWAVRGLAAPFLVLFLADLAFVYHWRHWLAGVAADVEEAAHELTLLSEVLARIEQERFHTSRLAQLRAALDIRGYPVSRRIAKLNRLMELLDSSDHLLVRVIGAVILWKPQILFALELWRRESGPLVRGWLAAAGEIEALSALANYAFEHPADPFPEFSEGAPLFDGEALGHPLMPDERFVRNSVSLGGELRVLVISGSNMSGKSTLLRTVGVNAVLAFAGAPVRARRLGLSPLSLGASIRVLDSLQGGVSRFYAEIKRLRKLVDLTDGRAPLLFLLDEFLHGTNSHDRKIGAEAIVRGLVERNAIGLVTTHDLALAHIADVLAPRATNVHFEDQLENGKMSFDYIMRPGVVHKSNALELMRSIGLDV
jgi:MutS domain V